MQIVIRGIYFVHTDIKLISFLQSMTLFFTVAILLPVYIILCFKMANLYLLLNTLKCIYNLLRISIATTL